MAEFPSQRFINYLAASLIRDHGWLEQQFPDQLETGLVRLLLDGAGTGMAVVHLEPVTAEAAQAHLKVWSAFLGQVKGRFKKFSIQFVCQDCEPDLRRRLLKEKVLFPVGTFLKEYIAVGVVEVDHCTVSGKQRKLFDPILDRWRRGEEPELEETELGQKLLESEVARTTEFTRRLQQTRPLGTWALTAVCVATFLWTTVNGGSEQILVLLRHGANYGPLVKNGEWWRLVGSMFLHIGIIHLLVNMWALYVVGGTYERFLGTIRFLALYAVAGLGGALASALVSHTVSAGASGALFGLFGGLAYTGYRYSKEIPASVRKQMTSGIVATIGYNLIFGFVNTGIDNAAHLGGLVGGTLFALLLTPRTLEEDGRAPALMPLLVLLAALPFGVEGYVAYRAQVYATISEYPRAEFRPPYTNGSTLTHSLVFFPTKAPNGNDALAGPGMALSWFAGALDGDLRSTVEEVGKGGAIEFSKVEEQAIEDRTWLVATGKKSGQTLYLAMTEHEGTGYGFIMFAAEATMVPLAREELQQVMESFRPGE